MSSPELRQPVFTFCRAGSSWALPTAPTSWKPREEFSAAYVAELDKLAQLVQRHFPEKTSAIQYLEAWLDQPLLPSAPPIVPKYFEHRARRDLLGAVGPALDRATAVGGGETKRMGVSRRARGPEAESIAADMPLHAWVAFKKSVGEDAA